MTIWRMRIACWIPKAINTCNTYCFSIATMVTRTSLNVTLYAYCLSFFSFTTSMGKMEPPFCSPPYTRRSRGNHWMMKWKGCGKKQLWQLNALSRNLKGEIDGNHKNPNSGYPMCDSTFRNRTSGLATFGVMAVISKSYRPVLNY